MTTDHTLRTQLDTLRAQSPQRFGLLQHHHTTLKAALDASTQNYPTSRQLYDQLDDPSITSRTFGRILPLLIDFDIISLYTTRSNSNRYDIRAYDAERFSRLSELLSAQHVSSTTDD